MSHSTPLLKPMAPDALLRRPAAVPPAQAPAPVMPPVAEVLPEELPAEEPAFVLPPEYAQPPAYCAPPIQPDALTAEPEAELDALLEAFPEEEDEELIGPDFMPTERMPEPVNVPLYDLTLPPKKRSLRWIAVVFALLVFAALCTLGYKKGAELLELWDQREVLWNRLIEMLKAKMP